MNTLIKRAGLTLFVLWGTIVSWAQDEKKVDVDINLNHKGPVWYQQTWVWVVGAAIFILLLVAILKSGSRKEA